MNCPNCSSKMESESSAEVTFSPGPESSKSAIHTPTVLYRCEECDAEFVWRKGVRGLRLLDGGRSALHERERAEP